MCHCFGQLHQSVAHRFGAPRGHPAPALCGAARAAHIRVFLETAQRGSGKYAVASTSIRMSSVGNIALTSTTVEAGGSPVKKSLRTRL
jgi:hypothetical protein